MGFGVTILPRWPAVASHEDRSSLRLSFAVIAERLNAEGHPSRTGKPWAPETVRQIATRGRGE